MFDQAAHPVKNPDVGQALDTSAPADDASTASSGPDWDLIPFEVGCARCGQDLRGLAEATCPACGLTFDWAAAAPIEKLTCLSCGYHLCGLSEMRCPECGRPFTWDEVLADYRRREKPLFEYRWRDRPVRSLIYTWYSALRPGKFWRSIDIHDPPQVCPLLITVLVSLLALGLTVIFLSGLENWLGDWSRSARGWGVRRWAGGRPGLADLPRYLLTSLGSPPSGLLTLTAVWLATSIGALMVFRQSMRLYKVRSLHVVRVWAHSLPVVIPVAPIVVYLHRYVLTLQSPWYRFDMRFVLLVVLVVLLQVMLSLRCAYRDYLRIPHAAGVAIACQTMALLATISVTSLLTPQFGRFVLVAILECLGRW